MLFLFLVATSYYIQENANISSQIGCKSKCNRQLLSGYCRQQKKWLLMSLSLSSFFSSSRHYPPSFFIYFFPLALNSTGRETTPWQPAQAHRLSKQEALVRNSPLCHLAVMWTRRKEVSFCRMNSTFPGWGDLPSFINPPALTLFLRFRNNRDISRRDDCSNPVLTFENIIYSNSGYYSKPSVDGGLGGQGSLSQRNRINGVSPLRSFLQHKNAFSQDTEIFKKPLLGRGKDERGKMAARPSQGQRGASGELCASSASPEGERGWKTQTFPKLWRATS